MTLKPKPILGQHRVKLLEIYFKTRILLKFEFSLEDQKGKPQVSTLVNVDSADYSDSKYQEIESALGGDPDHLVGLECLADIYINNKGFPDIRNFKPLKANSAPNSKICPDVKIPPRRGIWPLEKTIETDLLNLPVNTPYLIPSDREGKKPYWSFINRDKKKSGKNWRVFPANGKSYIVHEP